MKKYKYEITIQGIGFWSSHRKLEAAKKELLNARKKWGRATLWENDRKLEE